MKRRYSYYLIMIMCMLTFSLGAALGALDVTVERREIEVIEALAVDRFK